MTAPVAEERPLDRRVSYGLVLLLVFSFVLRLWNASAELSSQRYFDERFSLRNVSNVLLEGTSRPDNAFYGSLSYLPQTGLLALSQKLYELTGAPWLAVFDDNTADGYSATAYFLCRLVCVVFGTLSIWLTFVVGRRLFDERVALLGAALLAGFPRHVVASTEFKPDILVVLLTLLTFDWSLGLVRRPTLRRFALAGFGVGLAVATKYTGVGVALPLTVGVLFYRWRELRSWLGLALAGLTSIVTFFLLNVHVAVVLEYLPRIWSIMESKGEATGGSHWTMVWLELEFLLRHHRLVVTAFAVAGLCGVVARAVARGTERWTRLDAVMVLSYVIGYSALYAAATKLFRGQNVLPVAAFTSLFAAWAMLGAWRWLAARLPVLRRRAVAAGAWSVILILVYTYPLSLVYHDVIPSTYEQVEKLLTAQLRPIEQRQLVYERLGERLRIPSPGGHEPFAVPVERLSEVPSDVLDRSDAELFLDERLSGDGADFYLRRIAASPVRPRRLEPGLFSAHGPTLVLMLHLWKLRDDPTRLDLVPASDGRFQTSLAEPAAADETLSLLMWLPHDAGKPQQLVVNGRETPLFRTRRGGRRSHYVTPRFVLGAETAELTLAWEPPLHLSQLPEVRLCRWTEPSE